MPFFEISGEIFETEYGPITEKEVFEAIDDMTAFYILSEGDFSDVRLQRFEEIAMDAAHRSLRKSVRSGVGVVDDGAGAPPRRGDADRNRPCHGNNLPLEGHSG